MSNTVGFNLRLTPREREVVRKMAAKERRSDTAMIRITIIEAARARDLWPENDEEGGE